MSNRGARQLAPLYKPEEAGFTFFLWLAPFRGARSFCHSPLGRAALTRSSRRGLPCLPASLCLSHPAAAPGSHGRSGPSSRRVKLSCGAAGRSRHTLCCRWTAPSSRLNGDNKLQQFLLHEFLFVLWSSD